MFEKCVEILKKYTNMPVEEITPQTALQADMGLNSLDVVNIVVDFEDEFDIEIPDRLIKNFVKVVDIVEYMEKN